MFGNRGYYSLQPFSLMRDELPVMAREPGDLLDKLMEMSEPWSTGALLVDSLSPWSRPRPRCCPHMCVSHRPPQRSSLQHFTILPSLLRLPTFNDHQHGDDHNSEQGATDSKQCQGKDTASSEQEASASTTNDAAETSSSSSSSKGKKGDSPWQFSVDMKGCDEVRAMTEKGMLVVEGRGSSDTSQQIVRYITSMPPHVSHDSLTATLNNGCLTVTQKKGHTQLEGQPRTLSIDVQQQQQQQESTEQNDQQQQQQEQNQDPKPE